MKIQVIILCGGSGTRLWPISTEKYPKPFINFFGERSLLDITIERSEILDPDEINIFVNEKHKHLISKNNLQKLDKVFCEPYSRNTTPPICLAALNSDPEDILLIFPSDHFIKNHSNFKKNISQMVKFAQKDYICLFGVKPTEPNVGYGYIKKGKKINPYASTIESFEEKPKQFKAQKFFKSNKYLWNSGIFGFKAKVILDEMRFHDFEMIKKCEELIKTQKNNKNFLHFNENIFSKLKNESIDYSIMEKTKKSILLNLNCSWSDMGTWESIYNQMPKDKNKNVIQGNISTLDSNNSFIYSKGRKFIGVQGLKDISLVESEDSIFISKLSDSKTTRKMYEFLRNSKKPHLENLSKEKRPWGEYESLLEEKILKVKKIIVMPGEKLSLQYHYKREEHWVITSGKGVFTKNNRKKKVKKGDYLFIRKKDIHSIENTQKTDSLEFVEVQLGKYLGEDDIVRLKDKYGRE